MKARKCEIFYGRQKTCNFLFRNNRWCVNRVLWCGYGVQTDNPLLVQLAIVFGADVNGYNDRKETPRHKAAAKKGTPNRLWCAVGLDFIPVLVVPCSSNWVVWQSEVYSCMHGQAPQYLMDFCHPTSSVASRQQLRSASRWLLVVPRCRLNTTARRAFSVVGPSVWNSLPDYLRDSDVGRDKFQTTFENVYVRSLLAHTAH